MNVEKIDFSQTQAFTPIFLDYLAQKEALRDFYHRAPQLASFANQLAEKQLGSEVRRDLVAALLSSSTRVWR